MKNTYDKPIISIIVPVYNTEKYLRRCIESIQRQSFSKLQIILIDDGSTDKSLEICREYMSEDKRIIVIHKENGGQSTARNVGLDRASGNYVGFVDSDDYIDENMFSQLYSTIKKYDADIATCGIYDVYKQNTKARTKEEETFVLEKIEACKRILENKSDATVVFNKLYKKSIFESIRFPEGKIMEDDFICTRLFLKSEKVAVITKPYYYYNHRDNSTTTRRFNMSDLDSIEAYDENYELVKEQFPALINSMNVRKCWARFYVLDKLYLSREEKELPDLERELRTYLSEHKKEILCGNFFSLIKKGGFILLLIHPNLYKKFLHKRRGK